MSQQCCNAGSRLKSLLRFLSKYAAGLVLKPFEISNAGQKLHQQKVRFFEEITLYGARGLYGCICLALCDKIFI